METCRQEVAFQVYIVGPEVKLVASSCYNALLSVLDIVSDITLFFDYLLGREYITEYVLDVLSNDTSLDRTNRMLGNMTTWSCTIMNTTCSEEGPVMIACKWRDPWWAIFTLIFIYLPSFFVIAALYGPKKAGMVTSVESLFMLIVGGILGYIGYSLPSPAVAIMGWFIIVLGLAGVFGVFVLGFSRPSVLHFVLFIPLLIFSPAIYIFIKLLAVFEAQNMFIQSQSTYMSRGEAIFEATLQLILQLIVTMITMNPTLPQIFSIITSVATLSLPSIESYVTARGRDFGFDSIIANIAVFLPASLFKVLSVSIIFLFFNIYQPFFIFGFLAPYLLLLLYFRVCRYNKMRDFMQSEYVLLHAVTLASLGTSKLDAILRTWLTLLFTILYTIILSSILVICYVDPDIVPVKGVGWANFYIVLKPFFLNLIIFSTISLGWIPFFLDILITWCKCKFKDSLDDESGFWGKTVLLEGLFICDSKCTGCLKRTGHWNLPT